MSYIDDHIDMMTTPASRERRDRLARAAGVPRDVKRVPRPDRVSAPGLIDISKAPSMMEEAAKRWANPGTSGR